MPATPEEIRAAMEGLSPEQQAQFVSELERRRSASPTQPLAPSGSDWSGIMRPGMDAAYKAASVGLPLAATVVGAGGVIPALRGLGLGVAGAAAGGFGGRTLGQGLEAAGAPEGTSEVAGTIGGLAGGIAGPIGGPAVLSKLVGLSGGRGGLLSSIVSKLGGSAETAATTAVPDAVKQANAARIAQKAAQEAEKHAASMERIALQNEILKKRLSGELPSRSPRIKAPTTAPSTPPKPGGPDVTMPPTPAATVASPRAMPEPEVLVLEIQQKLAVAAPAERKAVMEWLKTQPKELRDAVARRRGTMPTNYGGKAQVRPIQTTGPGYELAKLLGQVQ